MTFPDSIWTTEPLAKIEGSKVYLEELENSTGEIPYLDLSNNTVAASTFPSEHLLTVNDSYDYNILKDGFYPDEISPRLNGEYLVQDVTANSNESRTYGGCSGSCVGCTTCNGCHSTVYNRNNRCTSGCTSNCASGCTNGCTTGCTSACTDNYEGRRASCPSGVTCDESRSNILVCSGCNTECNTCTNCTGCVSNVEKMYCTLATACVSCTTGVTAANVRMIGNETCRNGLNGLYEGAFIDKWIPYHGEMELVDLYVRPEGCKSDIEGFMETNTEGYIRCTMATTYYACRGVYSCRNGNTLYGW